MLYTVCIPAAPSCLVKHPYLERIGMSSELHGTCEDICMEMNPDTKPPKQTAPSVTEMTGESTVSSLKTVGGFQHF